MLFTNTHILDASDELGNKQRSNTRSYCILPQELVNKKPLEHTLSKRVDMTLAPNGFDYVIETLVLVGNVKGSVAADSYVSSEMHEEMVLRVMCISRLAPQHVVLNNRIHDFLSLTERQASGLFRDYVIELLQSESCLEELLR